MTIRTLVLTPHLELLPKSGEILFSGGWCLTRDVREALGKSGLPNKTAGYPWDDREMYRRDYVYLMTVYESYLGTIAAALNKLHGVRFDTAYWRLLAGPALYTILCHLLDRWRVAVNILEKETFDTVPFFDQAPYSFTPGITIDLNPDSDDYNHYLLLSALIAAGLDKAKLVGIDKKVNDGMPATTGPGKAPQQSVKAIAYAFIKKLVDRIRLGKGNRYFIFNSYLPRIYELLLNAALHNIPEVRRINRIAMPAVQPGLRAQLNLDSGRTDAFCGFASSMLSVLLPAYLIEGYSRLESCWRQCHWPEKPRSILTAVSYQFDEIFQHYAATMRSQFGTKLVFAQHGGVSGILQWSFGEDHQISVADKFISWGWASANRKIVPGFVFTNLGKKLRASSSGCLLLTTGSMRRYSHKGGAWPVGPNQAKAFLSDQLNFRRKLTPEIAQKFVLRIIEAQDTRFGSEYVDTWRSDFPDVRVDDSSRPISLALKKTKLFVYTYNSTGYLETMSMDFPTVMFWNPGLFETSPAFSKHLDELEKVGIFHRSPESAAAHVNRVWNDLNAWWYATEVRRCRTEFANAFARRPPRNWIGLFKKCLNG